MAKHRTHSIEFKRQVVQEFLGGESLYALARACKAPQHQPQSDKNLGRHMKPVGSTAIRPPRTGWQARARE
jgi:hypothetical protein